jgi:hypothetical protein
MERTQPNTVAPIPPPRRVEENHAVAADAGTQPSTQMQSAANADSEPAPPTIVAPIPAPLTIEERGVVAAEAESRPVPHIQSAARAALEAAQQRAAEIQQSQAKSREMRERPFPKPTLAPKVVSALKSEPAAKVVAEPEPAVVANEPEAKIIEADIKRSEEITIVPKTNQPEEKAVEHAASVAEVVPQRSIHRMLAALTDAMGPMASVVVRDHVDALGESMDNFPKQRFRELVYSTSGEILSEPLRTRYENVMSEEVRALGAFEE